MVVGIEQHRPTGKRGVAHVSGTAANLGNDGDDILALVKIVARENARQVADVARRVTVNFFAGGIGFGSAIGVELVQADGEQLHHLARVVFIGLAARRIFFPVALGVEEKAHGRVQRDGLQQVAVIPKGLRGQRVPVVGNDVAAPNGIQTGQRHHKKF